MPIIDFTEISFKDGEERRTDTFEQFARDFLEDYGFSIAEGPDRGADGGRDIIATEISEGVIKSVEFKWLVSCKHYATSNKAVSSTDEQDIKDRVIANKCDGFIGFYSTIPSSGLTNKLKGLGIDFHIFDKELIEKKLRRSEHGLELIERYFPTSFKKLISENPTPSNIFLKQLELKCEVCGKDILKQTYGGVLAFGEKDEVIEDIYITCKGTCDRQMERQFVKRGLFDMWFEVADFKSPLTYLHGLMMIKKDFLYNYKFTNVADFKLSKFLLITFQQIARNQSSKESELAEMIVDADELLKYFEL